MNSPNDPADPEATLPVVSPPPARRRRTVWERIGAGSLSISVLLHVILLIIGVFWVLQVVREPEKKVDFMPPAGGGGSVSSQVQAKKQRMNAVPRELPRLVATGVSSSIVLPEPDPASQLTELSSLSSGSLSGGMGGAGSGGGKGNGTGKGIGDGSGPGLGNGSGLKNPFGMLGGSKEALIGNFYDLKQTKDKKPTGFDESQTLKVLSDFVTKDNWNPRKLDDYFKAPNTLYQTKFYIPIMSAALAPEAFGCGKDVQPVFWVAHYRGMVVAPRSGRFRFVGRADNVMVVRFNRKVVLDGGDYSARLGKSIWDASSISVLAGTSGDREQEKEMRRGGYDIPVKSYRYPTSGQYNERGGVMVGKDFTVKEGTKYPVEILLSELGGLFGASLMIEEEGVEYKKDSAGMPILPLFRVGLDLPEPSTENRGSPPYDPEGPVWKVVPGEVIGGI